MKKVLKGLTEYKLAIFAFIAWAVLYILGLILGFDIHPLGTLQKIVFGIFAMIMIYGVAWKWFEKTFPKLKTLIDPDNTETFYYLDVWQKVKLSCFFFGLFVGGMVLIASLY
jgi:hypothetical protein